MGKKRYLTENERLYLYWMLGLTKKGIQNVTRGDEGISEYLTLLEKNLSEISEDINKLYGDIDIDIDIIIKSEDKDDVAIKWPNLLRCFLTIGARLLQLEGQKNPFMANYLRNLY